jgi:hypothetical protein
MLIMTSRAAAPVDWLRSMDESDPIGRPFERGRNCVSYIVFRYLDSLRVAAAAA